MGFKALTISKQWKATFQQKPDKYLLSCILKCFDIDNVDNNFIISKQSISSEKVIENFKNMIPEISLYYHNRTLNLFFSNDNLTFTKCITQLKNILYHNDYILTSDLTIIKKKKIILYKIMSKEYYTKFVEKPVKIERLNLFVDFS